MKPKSSRFVIILFCVFCVTWGQEKKMMVEISPSQVLEFRERAKICGLEYGVDPNDLRQIVTWTIKDDKPHKQFMYCIFFPLGYFEEDGHFNVEKVSTYAPVNGTLEDSKQIYENCNKITKDNNLDTMFEVTACFYRHMIPIINAPKAS